MFAAANLADLLMYKFARLSGGRFARALVLTGLLHSSSFWHDDSSIVHLKSNAVSRKKGPLNVFAGL
jgi:hypothetical protein